MSEGEVQSTELWTPPEKLNPNVAKMAWAMFLKTWEAHMNGEEGSDDRPIEEWAPDCYRRCIRVAKALEDINQDPGK